jgi:hypothetical protein
MRKLEINLKKINLLRFLLNQSITEDRIAMEVLMPFHGESWYPVSKYKEIFGEAAYKLSQARAKLMHLQDQIFIHLFKYFYFPNNKSVTGWQKELEGWRKTLSRYGSIPGGLSSHYSMEELMDAFFDAPFGTREDAEMVISDLIDDNYPELNLDEVELFKPKFKEFVTSYCSAIIDRRLSPSY